MLDSFGGLELWRHLSMKILVTGGAGFIGSAMVRHIIRGTQDSVINLDKHTYAGNLDPLPVYRQAIVMPLSKWISAIELN